MGTHTEVIYTKNPAYEPGNGQPEMLPAETILQDITDIPRVLTRKEFRSLVVAALGGNGTGTAALQTYIDAAIADAQATNPGKNRRAALEALRFEDTFSKPEAAQLLTALQFSGPDKLAISNAWPNV